MNASNSALGFDIGSDHLRALQLTADGSGAASISGFATVSRPESLDATADAAVKLLEALSPDDDTPVRLVDSASDSNEALEACTAALVAFGAQISELEVDAAVLRARSADVLDEGFVDCDVPAGLLAAHAGLDLANLAPAAGVALYELDLGFVEAADDAAEPIAVWTPDTDEADTDQGDSEQSESEQSDTNDSDTNDSDAVHSDTDADDIDAAVETPEVDDEGAEDTDVFGAAPAAVAGASVAGAAAAATTFFADDDDDTFFDDTDPGDDETTDGAGIVPVAAASGAATASAAATATPPAPPSTRPTAAPTKESKKRGGVPAWLWGLAALIGLGLVLWLLLRGGSDTEVTDSPDPTPVASAVEAAPTEAPEPTAVPEPTVEPEPTPEPEPTAAPTVEPTPTIEPTPDPLEGLPPLSELPAREAVFRPPNLYLLGPATEVDAARSYARALEVLPAENIIDEFIIRPDAPEPTDGNVRIEQAVLFATGSAQIAPPFIPILEIGVQLMTVNPEMSMVIEGHTDDVGPDALNLDLSQRRANAVVQYLVGRGIEPARLSAVGFGETDPVAPNDTEETRQVNRRIEVQMIDLLLPRDAEG